MRLASVSLHLHRTDFAVSLRRYLSFFPSSKTTLFGRALDTKTVPNITIKRANISVDGWNWTRGGNGKVYKEIAPLRRVAFWRQPSSRSQLTRLSPQAPSSLARHSSRVLLSRWSLQGPNAHRHAGSPRSNAFATPHSELQDAKRRARGEPSLPPLNLALTNPRQYTITVSIRLSNGPTDYYVASIPFQLTSGVTPVEASNLGGILEGEEEEE